MAAAHLQTQLLDTFGDDPDGVEIDGAEHIQLTPYLALACSLLYMMASDGRLQAQESSHLQGVLGGDKVVLRYGMRYVQQVSVEDFFLEANELLSTKDKWCILANVCDAMLSDGHADPEELALFTQMTQRFGLSTSQFEPYFKILALKNDKSVLGRYAGVKEDRQPMTPHFALAIALLYMLTSDGSIGKQEVGQLESVIGEFNGLQNVALAYVRSTKLKGFLDEASALLRVEQKIYILMNVCDCMLADGEVAQLEDKLFLSMLTAFGFSEKTFARFMQVLETKNLKPFDTSDFKNRVVHDRVLSGDDEAGVTFTHALNDGDGSQAGSTRRLDAANQREWDQSRGDATMREFIDRTMQDNIQSVEDGFGDQDNVVKVSLNATDGLNVQKIEANDALKNRQRLDDEGASENLQKIGDDAQDGNRQKIETHGQAKNDQLIELNALGLNRQTVDPEVRLQNIHEVVGEVSHRLDEFESRHLSFLNIGRAHKFNDSFELIEEDDSSVNRQLIEASFVRMGMDLSLTLATNNSAREAPAVEALTPQRVDAALLPSVPMSGDLDDRPKERAQQISPPSPLRHKQGMAWRLRGGNAGDLGRARGVAYVQWAVAVFALAFAAPIETRGLLSRSVVGPLIMAPVFTPLLSADDETPELTLSGLQDAQK